MQEISSRSSCSLRPLSFVASGIAENVAFLLACLGVASLKPLSSFPCRPWPVSWVPPRPCFWRLLYHFRPGLVASAVPVAPWVVEQAMVSARSPVLWLVLGRVPVSRTAFFSGILPRLTGH